MVLAKDKGSGELVAIRFFDNRLQHHGSRAVQWIPLEDKGAPARPQDCS